MRRLYLLGLFLVLCVIAAAGWLVDGLRWTITLGGSHRTRPLPRVAR